MIVRAERSFRRALAINPELSIAHSLYAQLELETNRAKEALVRLLGRARERRADPQLFAGLVQSCRYLGLLKASRAAHERAKQLDPTVQTSVAYTWRMMGDVERGVIEARLNADPVEGFLLAMQGRRREAIAVLDLTTRRYGKNRLWALWLATGRALVCGKTVDAVSLATTAMRFSFRDPEGLLYVCFVLSRMNERTLALEALRRADRCRVRVPIRPDM